MAEIKIGVSPAYHLSRYGDRFTPEDVAASLGDIQALGFSCFQLEVFHPDTLSDWLRRGAALVENAAKNPKHVKKNKKDVTPLFPKLTTYWARHTLATLMAEIDIPKETIAKVLGHADNDVTSIYIKFDQKKIDHAMRQVIDYINEK